jgi:DNA-binding CsgD family transcriptional regulator
VEPIINPYEFIGFGLHLLWMAEIILDSYPFAFSANPQFAALCQEISPISLILNTAVMLCMAWFIEHVTYPIRVHKNQLIICCLMSASALLLFIASFFSSLPLVICGYALAGATSGFFTLIWAEGFRRRETPQIIVSTVLALVVALLGYGALSVAGNQILTGVILCLLPLLQLAGIFIILHGKEAFRLNQKFTLDSSGIKRPVYGIREVPTFRNLKVNRTQLLGRLGVPFALLGLSFGPFLQQVLGIAVQANRMVLSDFAGISEDSGNLALNDIFLSTGISCLILLFIVFVIFAINSDNAYERYHRCVIPTVPVAIIATAYCTNATVHNVFLIFTFSLMTFIVWVELAKLSHEYRISPILIFGIALTFFIVLAWAGLAMTLWLENSSLLAGANMQNGTATLIVTVCEVLLFTIGCFLIPGHDVIREIVVLDANTNNSTNVTGKDDSGSEEQSEQTSRKTEYGRFLVRCEQVASTYLLTTREADLLYLLAKGRNTSHIAKQLFISEGTVHTHTWHIYRKLNVHTQQELIDLVDNHGRESEK